MWGPRNIKRPRSGRPLSTTPRENRVLTRLSLNNRRATSRNLKREFEDATGTSISPRTVRIRLQKSGLRGCIAAKKPLLTATHRKNRLNNGVVYYFMMSLYLS